MEPSETEAGILEIFQKNATPSEEKPLTRSTSISELGIASIDIYEILFAIEDRFGIEIDEKDFTIGVDTTIGDLLSYVEGRQHSSLAS